MFGLGEALLSFIRRQVGLRTDAASASGSLHAKVAETRNYIGGLINNKVVQKPRGSIKGSGSTYNEAAYDTILNVSGKGTLDWLWTYRANTKYSGKIRIYIDGTLIGEADAKRGVVDELTEWIIMAKTGIGSSLEPAPINLSFKNSLRIDTMHLSDYNSAIFYWIYSKE